MTTRGKSLNESSLKRIAYEQNEIARIEAAIADGKGNKRSQGALEKKRALIAKIEGQIAKRGEKAAAKAVEASNDTSDTSDTSAEDVLAAALEGAADVQVDELPSSEDVAV
jgi:hypothetical protein